MELRVRHTLADISKVDRCLGYGPEVSFKEGIGRTASYFSEQKQPMMECSA